MIIIIIPHNKEGWCNIKKMKIYLGKRLNYFDK